MFKNKRKKPAKASTLDIGKRFIMGRNCLNEVIKHRIESLTIVYTSKFADNDELILQLEENEIPVKRMERDVLDNLVESESHQGYVAVVNERPYLEMKSFLRKVANKERSLVIMLDSIFDPQNLGAIMRAAECFGADAVLWSKNRGVSITPTATKVGVGATELLDTIKVSNLAQAMKAMQKEGFYAVTADVGEDAQSLHDFTFPEKTLLILGSEGKGVQNIIKNNADFKVMIPMQGVIESLNVSQAASVFMSHWR